MDETIDQQILVVAYKLFRGSVSYYHSFEKYSDAPTLFGAFSFEPGCLNHDLGGLEVLKRNIFMSEFSYKKICHDLEGFFINPGLSSLQFERFLKLNAVAASFPLNPKNLPKSRFR